MNAPDRRMAEPWPFVPGAHDDVPIERYHAMPALSSTGAKRLLRSPAHYLLERTRPSAPTESMRQGSALHLLVLEPNRCDEVIERPKFDGRTNAGKAAAKEWAKQHPDATLAFEPAVRDALLRSADAVRAHPAAGDLLSDGVAERSIFWRDAAESAECRARFDWLTTSGVAVDLKSAADASEDGFRAAIGRYGYHVSAGHYWSGHEHVFDRSPRAWIFIAAEVEPPFAVAVYALDSASLRKGMDDSARAVRRFAQCQRSGVWPAYSDMVENITAPRWALRQENA